MHYWQSCPMLMGCAECGQVIEISALPEHLLDECQVRVRYSSANVSRFQKPCALTPQCFGSRHRVLLDAYEHENAITVARNVRADVLHTWQASANCKPPGRGGIGSACPLCYKDLGVADDEEIWRAHLIEACPKNARRA
eukprot:5462-Heterococcus_DN1.PRE.1